MLRAIVSVVSVGALSACSLTSTLAPGASDETGVADEHDASALYVDCRSYYPPATVEELDAWAGTYLGHPGFQGGDGAMSIKLTDGRRLTLFGDTLREGFYPGGSFARNSMMLLDDEEICVLTGPEGGEAVPDRSDGVGYWPMSVVVRTSGGVDDIAIMMQRAAMTATDELGFVILGTSLVRMRIPHNGVPRLMSVEDLQVDDPTRSSMRWGAALWPGTDEWIYIYGTRNPQRPGVFGWSLHAARASWTDLADQDQWQFWDGERWSSQRSQVATLIGAEGGVAQVLSVFARDDTWYAVSTMDGDLGDDVVVWTAPQPSGPFSEHPAVMSLPAEEFRGALTYLVVAHPDLFPAPGSVVISYSRGSTDWEALVRQPLRYRPAFDRIPLPVSSEPTVTR